MQRYGPSGFIADSLHPLNSLNLRRAQDAIEMPKHANAINVEPALGGGKRKLLTPNVGAYGIETLGWSPDGT